uniref:BZIP domain-containing protein n=1 Tax=Stomoxys calcitrans TaxID=35570 RepID=A0A1I8PEE3_STOCA
MEIPDYINPRNINEMVSMEMKRIQMNCAQKQQQYVEQMLMENPIPFERRTTAATREINSQLSADQLQILQQRSEACRRSRYNSKIRKAKAKYRHKYMTQKLLQSSKMFNCIQDLIGQAESQLLAQGLGMEKLQQLRKTYGMDMTMECTTNLEHQLKME